MKIDIVKLQNQTKDAIREAEQRNKMRLAELKAKSESEMKKLEAKVEKVLSAIPELCAKEAELGNSSATVYKLTYSEYEGGFPYNKLEPNKLKDAGAMIWNACQLAKLQPKLEHWYDDGGMNSGFNIVVHWG